MPKSSNPLPYFPVSYHTLLAITSGLLRKWGKNKEGGDAPLKEARLRDSNLHPFPDISLEVAFI